MWKQGNVWTFNRAQDQLQHNGATVAMLSDVRSINCSQVSYGDSAIGYFVSVQMPNTEKVRLDAFPVGSNWEDLLDTMRDVATFIGLEVIEEAPTKAPFSVL